MTQGRGEEVPCPQRGSRCLLSKNTCSQTESAVCCCLCGGGHQYMSTVDLSRLLPARLAVVRVHHDATRRTNMPEEVCPHHISAPRPLAGGQWSCDRDTGEKNYCVVEQREYTHLACQKRGQHLAVNAVHPYTRDTQAKRRAKNRGRYRQLFATYGRNWVPTCVTGSSKSGLAVVFGQSVVLSFTPVALSHYLLVVQDVDVLVQAKAC